jgi:hypothetical protein
VHVVQESRSTAHPLLLLNRSVNLGQALRSTWKLPANRKAGYLKVEHRLKDW